MKKTIKNHVLLVFLSMIVILLTFSACTKKTSITKNNTVEINETEDINKIQDEKAQIITKITELIESQKSQIKKLYETASENDTQLILNNRAYECNKISEETLEFVWNILEENKEKNFGYNIIKLREQQKNWKQFRELIIDVFNEQYKLGSARSMYVNSVSEILNTARMYELTKYLGLKYTEIIVVRPYVLMRDERAVESVAANVIETSDYYISIPVENWYSIGDNKWGLHSNDKTEFSIEELSNNNNKNNLELLRKDLTDKQYVLSENSKYESIYVKENTVKKIFVNPNTEKIVVISYTCPSDEISLEHDLSMLKAVLSTFEWK